jgi:hypothetical protein
MRLLHPAAASAAACPLLPLLLLLLLPLLLSSCGNSVVRVLLLGLTGSVQEGVGARQVDIVLDTCSSSSSSKHRC